ncbi:MAG TPA: hypothetical protein VLA48_02770 [Nitrososphaeraceae archaeon]|nr:hypothetical protein [Nitrososphaeraceae archaeon]
MNKIDRTGEKHITKQGYSIEIIKYIDYSNCTVQFEDGLIKKACYGQIKNKTLRKPTSRIGEKWINNEGHEVEIIEYFNAHNCTIKFSCGYIKYNVCYGNVLKGTISYPFHKSVYGVGYYGIGNYGGIKDAKAYYVWHSMIGRCYSQKELLRYPTYSDCSVIEEWYDFQKFTKWFYENYKKGFHLDKDILVKGNKIYSPETCCFVPHEINSLFTKTNAKRGQYPIGVSKNGSRYLAKLNHKYIKNCKTPEEAFEAYKIAKEVHIKELADRWKDQIDEKLYQAMYTYEVEITD